MNLDWDYVKKTTLWQYEKLIVKLEEALAYTFVQEFYNHDMRAAVLYAEKIQSGYRLNTKEIELDEAITRTFERLDTLGVQNYSDLVGRVNTKPKCELFLEETSIDFQALIEVLNYLFRWVLPFRIPVKELVDTLPEADNEHLGILKRQEIRANLDVLETFRTPKRRVQCAAETG